VIKQLSGLSAMKESARLIKGKVFSSFIILIVSTFIPVLIVTSQILINQYIFHDIIFSSTLSFIVNMFFDIASSFAALYLWTLCYIFYINRDMLINGINTQEITEEEPVTEPANQE
jgi:hypothetical protein